jgi:hypothetical protein
MNTANMPDLSLLTAFNTTLNCDLIGKKLDTIKEVTGLMPVKSELQSVINRDILLIGKLDYHEKGFIFHEERLGIFVVPFGSVRKLTFHIDNDA